MKGSVLSRPARPNAAPPPSHPLFHLHRSPAEGWIIQGTYTRPGLYLSVGGLQQGSSGL